ncbi:hypothetical protein CBER1_06840 [Cercospora berteroae]|uniref:Uncharacterized protein n=1 Tax=Cercospora berteroae TaxID=357750 RepID=A0A2S6BU44_9PEZI|nr:hypothetical protein CBER1_06840 [Cercospora berteroae]
MSTPDRAEQRGLLNDASPIPAAGPTSPTVTSPRHRPGYQRVPTVSFSDTPPTEATTAMAAEEEKISTRYSNDNTRRNHGLGIISGGTRDQQADITPATPQQSASARNSSRMDQSYTPYSASSTAAMTGSTKFEDSFDISYDPKHRASRTSLQSGAPSIYAKSDAGLLSVRTAYNEFAPHNHCPSKKSYKHGRFSNWISMTILTLAIFSTVFSLIFLIIALRGPKYGRKIRNGGSLTPSSAAFLTSFFAKLIELSFVTVVVAFIGQALARRAFKLERARGITLAELNMRAWILQPGTMLTQWESVKYAGISFLGIVSFLGAVFAILYTSAATALVQPQLVLPGFDNRVLQGLVKAQYANPDYVAKNCKTPIKSTYDQEFAGAADFSKTTCLQIEYAASAYSNFHSYLATWRDHAQGYGNGTDQLQTRPPGYAQFNGNTTVAAPWIERTNVTQAAYPNYIINNVTMAMPHMGIVQAAIDPANDIMQPSEVEGALYNIRASVPSPMVNVLCLTMDATKLKPFVYNTWDDRNKTACNETDWATNGAWPRCADYNGTFLNLTNHANWDANLEDMFHWGDKWGANNSPPIFPRLPDDYNTLLNDTIGMSTWGAKSIYLLLKGGPTNRKGTSTQGPSGPNSTMEGQNYALCQLQVGLTPNCVSSYNASISGGSMEAVCETGDTLQYNQSQHDAPQGISKLSQDWVNIGGEWARSLSLNAGLRSGNASNARLLSQLIVTEDKLDIALPSTAEALAVLAGNTLLQSSADSPFTMFWNYTDTMIDGSPQYFNASVRIQQYASGGSAALQKPFYVVLVAVFVINAAILGYFFCHRDWYTDFSEPVHLFSLAVNSPPSYELAGSCGSGPSGEMYKTSWKMHRDGEHFYVDSQKQTGSTTMEVDSPRFSRRRLTQTFEMGSPIVGKLKDRFSRQSFT